MLHCISKDLKFGKGIAKSIDKEYNSKNFCTNKMKRKTVAVGNCIKQIVGRDKIIFHLVTKEKIYD